MQPDLANNQYSMTSLFLTAFAFANEKHQSQKITGSELPYISHISSVCFELLLLPNIQIYDCDFMLSVASLHDTLEDTETSEEEVLMGFGKNILSAVKALSKNYLLPKEEQIKDSIDRILLEPTEVQLVKLADRISNLNPPPVTWSQEKILSYYNTSILIYSRLKHANEYLAKKLLKRIEDYKKYL